MERVCHGHLGRQKGRRDHLRHVTLQGLRCKVEHLLLLLHALHTATVSCFGFPDNMCMRWHGSSGTAPICCNAGWAACTEQACIFIVSKYMYTHDVLREDPPAS